MIAPYSQTSLDQFALLSEEDLTGVFEQHALEASVMEERKRQIAKVLMDKLTALGFGPGQSFLREDGIGAAIRTKLTRTLDKGRLAAAGVDPDVINNATVETESAPFLVVVRPRAKKGSNESTVTELFRE